MLKDLYNDKATLMETKQYFLERIGVRALNDLYAGKDVTAFHKAKQLIDMIWDEMDVDFGERAKKPIVEEAK